MGVGVADWQRIRFPIQRITVRTSLWGFANCKNQGFDKTNCMSRSFRNQYAASRGEKGTKIKKVLGLTPNLGQEAENKIKKQVRINSRN